MLTLTVDKPLRSGGSEKPIRSTNDVDLFSFGSAQLVIVARLIAWRSVRAEANRFRWWGGHVADVVNRAR